jgi:hypothetical protein
MRVFGFVHNGLGNLCAGAVRRSLTACKWPELLESNRSISLGLEFSWGLKCVKLIGQHVKLTRWLLIKTSLTTIQPAFFSSHVEGL